MSLIVRAETLPADKSLDGGVLAKGQTVWLESTRERKLAKILVPAFVEHLGTITIDERFLVDLGQHVTSSLETWEDGSPSVKKHTMTKLTPSRIA